MRARHPRGAQVAALTPIVRRLHLQELQRIRRAAVRAERDLEYYREAYRDECSRSDMFHQALMQAENIELGLTRDGQLLVAAAEATR